MMNKVLKQVLYLYAALIAAYQPIDAFTIEETAILERFFQVLFTDSEAGYVFFGEKPCCIEGIIQDDTLFGIGYEFHGKSVALKEGARIWNRVSKGHSNFIIHIGKNRAPYVDVVVINRELFLKVVRDNLPLFQYVLGPKVTPEGLLDCLLSNEQHFDSLVKSDKVLTGILLGFGTQNSLLHSRYENISESAESLDNPPFKNKSETALDFHYYFAFDKEDIAQLTKKSLTPSFGYHNLIEEINELNNRLVISKDKLASEKPYFIFGYCSHDKSSEDQVMRLEAAQIKIQNLLKSPHFLAEILGDLPQGGKFHFEFKKFNKCELSHIVYKHIMKFVRGFDAEFQEEFIEAFVHSTLELPPIFRPFFLPNFMEAKNNLLATEKYFDLLAKDSGMQMLVPGKLFYRQIKEGEGNPFKNFSEGVFRYQVSDSRGNLIAVTFQGEPIHLNETIPGFALGVQGMRIGETREVVIHPSLAYGVCTFLDRGCYLNLLVTLEKVQSNEALKMEPEKHDLSFLLDGDQEHVYIKEHAQSARWLAGHIRSYFSRSNDIDIKMIADSLKNCSEFDLTEEEKDVVNKIHWNILYGHYQ